MESNVVKEFMYMKEGAYKKYAIVQMKDMETSIEGISLEGLSPEDQNKVKEIYTKFLADIKPYMKNYRKFVKASIKA